MVAHGVGEHGTVMAEKVGWRKKTTTWRRETSGRRNLGSNGTTL